VLRSISVDLRSIFGRSSVDFGSIWVDFGSRQIRDWTREIESSRRHGLVQRADLVGGFLPPATKNRSF
jgi:hypothetical protein